MSFEITANHIRFWDAQKLRRAHEALENSEARQKLTALYLKSKKVRRLVWARHAPKLPEAPSVNTLIPKDERNDSIFHRRATGRRNARDIRGKDHHLMGNLSNFIANKLRRGESLEEAVLSYCGPLAGHQPYAKFARRWARKLRIEVPST